MHGLYYSNKNKYLSLAFLFALFCPVASSASSQAFLVLDNVIKDVRTRLIWSRDANPGHYQMSWHDAVAYVKLLNDRQYGGRSDWRLPDLEEMKKLTDNARAAGPSAGPAEKAALLSVLSSVGFRNVEAGGYWTSSSSIFNETEAWYFSMIYGDKFVGSKSLYMYVWPVRWDQQDGRRRPARP